MPTYDIAEVGGVYKGESAVRNQSYNAHKIPFPYNVATCRTLLHVTIGVDELGSRLLDETHFPEVCRACLSISVKCRIFDDSEKDVSGIAGAGTK
jgi:hypothetical protein